MSTRIITRILRTLFNLLYHQFAWTYDWVAYIVSAGNWSSWVQSTLPFLHGSKILELGYGPGHLQVALNHAGKDTFGLDESSQMSQIAYHRLRKLGIPPRLSRGDAQSLPYKANTFDHVVMTFPAEFLLRQENWQEIRRVLRPGGSVVVVPMAWVTGRLPHQRAVAWLNRITGEAPPWNEQFLEPYRANGFYLQWEFVNLPSSRVLIVLWEKPGD